jgi:Flp pilus assembly pilin Flp
MQKKSLIKRLTGDRRGLATMEYGVLFVIIIVGALVIWSRLGTTMTGKVNPGIDKMDTTLGTHETTDGTAPPKVP